MEKTETKVVISSEAESNPGTLAVESANQVSF